MASNKLQKSPNCRSGPNFCLATMPTFIDKFRKLYNNGFLVFELAVLIFLWHGINNVIHFASLQFAFDFVETHRVKECHVSACTKSGIPVHGTDSPLLGSYRTRQNSKDRPVGVWNVDGEVLRQASLSLRYVM